jgi:cephalosporin hydroxylase
MPTANSYNGVPIAMNNIEIGVLKQLVSDYKVKMAVDLGTSFGGSSELFASFGLEVVTFDIVAKATNPRREVCYVVGDIFSGQGLEWLVRYCKDGRRKILFCDNGNKAMEITMLGPHLNKGDILAGHDYGTEWVESDVKNLLACCKFRQIEVAEKARIMAWEKMD